MTVLGYIFLTLIAITVLTAAAVAVRSIPDMRRYSRIRKM